MMGRAQNPRQIFIAGLTLLVGGMLAISAFTLFQLRKDSIANGLNISSMHSRGFEDFLTQNLHVVDLVAANILRPTPHLPTRQDIESAFKATIERAPFLRSISLLDENSRIVASSNPANLGQTVSVAGYLPPLNSSDPILRIGQPWAGRDFASGQPSSPTAPISGDALYFIPISRTLKLSERRHTLLIAFNPDYFLTQVAQKVLPEEGTVEVLRYDGILLMDSRPENRPGTLRDNVVRALQIPDIEFGQFEQELENGKGALTSFRASRLYPLIIVTRMDREAALHRWRAEERTLLAVVLPALSGVIIFAILYYRRQVQLAEQRARSERLERINAASVFTNAREGIMITDANGAIVDVNESFTTITGYGRDEVLGKNPRILRSDRQEATFYQAMWKDLTKKGFWAGEIWNCRKDGGIFAGMLTISAVRDDQGRTHQYVALFSDITELKEYERELEFAARYDQLTKLPNRALMADRMEHAMAQTLRRGQHLAVVFLDLDGFKSINDSYGHEAGDQLLIGLASHLKHALREGDTLARIGGDEFVALLMDLSEPEAAQPILDRLLSAATEPVQFGEKLLRVSASVGVAFYPQEENIDANRLLCQADRAMYMAKQCGKNRIHVLDAA